MCGEKHVCTGSGGVSVGSPPRVRGKVLRVCVYRPDARITPACAGKRKSGKSTLIEDKDHPRVCGEKSKDMQKTIEDYGSPPRVRGKEILNDLISSGKGITPACAGKSFKRYAQLFAIKDHPRVCGEKFTSAARSLAQIGSPPRVRGKAEQGGHHMGKTRITPACAGKRALSLQSRKW